MHSNSVTIQATSQSNNFNNHKPVLFSPFVITDKIEQLKTLLPSVPQCISLKKESSTSMAGACPKCGGKDRFVYRTDSQKSWCRNCAPENKPMDIINFHCWFYNKTISELIKEYLSEENNKTNDANSKWLRIINNHADLTSCYNLFRKRLITDEITELLIEQGKISSCDYLNKKAVAFPFTDMSGNVLFIQYLTADESNFPYIDSKKSFNKGSHISENGFFQCGKSIHEDSKGIILVEGVINAISGAQIMPDYTWIATGSANSTHKKVHHLIPYISDTKPLICAFDNDKAGEKTVIKVKQELKDITIMSIKWKNNDPKGHDINNLLKQKQSDRLIKLIKDATVVDYIKHAKTESKPQTSEMPFCFWSASKDKYGDIDISIKHNELCETLEKMGYGNATINKTEIHIKVTNNVVEEKTVGNMRKDLMNNIMNQLPEYITAKGWNKQSEEEFIYTFPKSLLKEKLRQGIANYLSEPKIQSLNDIEIKLCQDTADKTHLFYQNGFVEITKDSIKFKPYSELDGSIWKDGIVKRNVSIDSSISSDFEQFTKNTCTDPLTGMFDAQRYEALKTAIGYMANRFNDPAYPKTVIFSDGNLKDNANGGTGKTIIARSIGYLRNQSFIDGKITDFKGQFAFQSINLDTNSILIDDVDKNFNFETFYGSTTYGYKTEKKHKDAIQFTPENNPKTIITTNYSVNGDGASHQRRTYEIELYPYYSEDKSPHSDFGSMFDGWSEEQWSGFDNFMFSCVQEFHQNNNRMKTYESETLEIKKLMDSIGIEFIDYMDDLLLDSESPLTQDSKKELPAGEVIAGYKNVLTKKGADLVSDKAFGNKLEKYCNYNNITLTKVLRGKKNNRHKCYVLELNGEETEIRTKRERIVKSKPAQSVKKETVIINKETVIINKSAKTVNIKTNTKLPLSEYSNCSDCELFSLGVCPQGEENRIIDCQDFIGLRNEH